MTDITKLYEEAYLAGNWAKQSELLNAYSGKINFDEIHICQLHDFCSKGNLSNVKDILNTNPHLYNDYYSFYSSCIYGHLHIAKYLFSLYTNADKTKLFTTYRNAKSDVTGFEHTFRITCVYNKLEVAKWLYTINSSIVDTTVFIKAFDNVCCSGNIEFVKWFYTIISPKNKPNEYGNGYRWATNAGHIEIANLIKHS